MKGDIDQISSCLLKGASIHENASGYNCLHYAIARDNANTPEVIKTLLEANANINAVDQKGYTPLMHAVKKIIYLQYKLYLITEQILQYKTYKTMML